MIETAGNVARLETETAFDVLARAAALQAQGRSIVNLGIGQPDFEPPAQAVEAAIRALRDGPHGYSAPEGIAPLREAVAADVERRLGAGVDPGQVVIVPGGKVTIFFAIMLFGEAGAEIIYPDPGFPIYRSAIGFSGAAPVPIPLEEADGFAFSAERLLDLVTPRTRLIILNSPANPTGGVTPPAQMDALAEGLEAHPQVAVLSDEIYSQMLYEDHVHRSILAYPALRDRAILLDGWSKTYAMTGWRLGYGVWPTALVEPVKRLAVNCHSCVNLAAQQGALVALTGSQQPVADMIAAFAERRRFLLRALKQVPGLSCVEPGGAFYCFPNIAATGLTAKQVETGLLEEAGVATIAGTSFGPHGEGFLRLSYANSLANIEEAMARIGTWMSAQC